MATPSSTAATSSHLLPSFVAASSAKALENYAKPRNGYVADLSGWLAVWLVGLADVGSELPDWLPGWSPDWLAVNKYLLPGWAQRKKVIQTFLVTRILFIPKLNKNL